MRCGDCCHCVYDKRPGAYMRDTVCFCRRKGPLFSRNHRPEEGARILPGDEACPAFERRLT